MKCKILNHSILFSVLGILNFSCNTVQSIPKCEIVKIFQADQLSDDSYFYYVKFKECSTKELRESLLKSDIAHRFSTINGREIQVYEYLGKLYNEYKYEIKIR